jgi:hypothetical protein
MHARRRLRLLLPVLDVLLRNMTIRTLLAILLLAGAVRADAAELAIELTAPDHSKACLAGAVRITATSGTDSVEADALLDGAARVAMALPRSGVWRVRAEREGCWAPSAAAVAGETVTLSFSRLMEVTGSLVGRIPADSSISGLAFLRKESRSRDEGEPVSCELLEGRWRCDLPAGVELDLRIEIAGYAALHYWDVAGTPEHPPELPSVRLAPGASVAGWVERGDRDPVAGARVVLHPLQARRPGDRGLETSRRRIARTNDRGFFQFEGLSAGEYGLVSEIEGLSPAVVEPITVVDGESLVWPRPIRHAPLATLRLALTPRSESESGLWAIELMEPSPLIGSRPAPIEGTASAEGMWESGPLRATRYELVVKSGNGSVFHRETVDASGGGELALMITLPTLLRSGTLRAGDEPLEAGITFLHVDGQSVHAASGEDGSFQAVFPRTGTWSPKVRLGRGRSELRIAPVEIEQDDRPIDLSLPGGRIRGTVADAAGTPVKAAVHLTIGRELVAQRLTEGDGGFEFVGIAPDSYQLHARGVEGTAVVPARIEESETIELDLVLQPYRRVSGSVVTPSGTPASGAVVAISTGNMSWVRVPVDRNGTFRHDAPADAVEAQVAVLTYSYPIAFRKFPIGDPALIVLTPAGGLLRIRWGDAPVPWLSGNGVTAPLGTLFFPEPFGRFGGGLYLEQGSWRTCSASGDCRDVQISPGGEVVIDFRSGTSGETDL